MTDPRAAMAARDDADLRAAARAADAVAAPAPGRPVVGYEDGDRLADARTAGFAPVDALRVWIAPSPRPG